MKLYRETYRDKKTGKKKRSRPWRVRFSIEGRRRDVTTALTDKRAAEIKAHEIVKSAQMRAAGIETYEATRSENIGDLVEEFAKELARRGRSARHAKEVKAKLDRCFNGMSDLSLCTTARIRQILQTIEEKGTPATMNRYRAALSIFFNWLVREDRWHENPAKHVAAGSEAQGDDSSRPRRAASPEEFEQLLKVAPLDRAIVYLAAATTGLRRSELGALRWDDLDLDSNTPTVRARASTTKNRKEAVLPLPKETAEALMLLRDQDEGERVFRRIPATKVLRKDFAAARAKWIEDAKSSKEREDRERSDFLVYCDREGRYLDFHALGRVTFGTNLAREDVVLQKSQRLLRHSDPKLTAQFYTKLELFDLHDAVGRIGRALPYPSHYPSTATTSHHAALPCTTDRRDDDDTHDVETRAQSGKGPQDAGPSSGAPSRIRTWDLRIKNPLLCQLS